MAMTAVPLGTDAMTVAPAITNPFSRHPVTTAAAIATLAEMAPGRVWHGLGVGGSRVLEPLGLAPARPYSALVDAFEVDAALLAGHSCRRGLDPVDDRLGAGGDRRSWAARAAVGSVPRWTWVASSAKPRAHLAVRGGSSARNGFGGDRAVRVRGVVSGAAGAMALRHFSYMAVDAPADIRAAAGPLDDERLGRLSRAAMLAGRMDDAARCDPPRCSTKYGVAAPWTSVPPPSPPNAPTSTSSCFR